MPGYSGRSLIEKPGIKEGFTLYVNNAPAGYTDIISPIPAGATLSNRISKDLDIIRFFTRREKELNDCISRLVLFIKQDGMIWISWPKKASKVPTDITEDTIRRVILPLGLVDIKVCAVDETWSGLKVVIRKELRK